MISFGTCSDMLWAGASSGKVAMADPGGAAKWVGKQERWRSAMADLGGAAKWVGK